MEFRARNSRGVENFSSLKILFSNEGPESPDSIVTVNARTGAQFIRTQILDGSWASFSDSFAGILQYEFSAVDDDMVARAVPLATSKTSTDPTQGCGAGGAATQLLMPTR